MGGIAGDIIGGVTGWLGADKASDQLAGGYREGLGISQKAIQDAINDINTRGDLALNDIISGFGSARGAISETGPALNLEQALTGVLGPEAQRAAFESFQASPGQDFLRNEQEQSLLRNAAAIGGIGGGNVRTALQEQAYGRASTNLQQALENIRSLRGNETNTQTNLANLFTGQAGATSGIQQNLAQLLANTRITGANQQIPMVTGMAGAEASGTMGKYKVLGETMGNVAGTVGSALGGLF